MTESNPEPKVTGTLQVTVSKEVVIHTATVRNGKGVPAGDSSRVERAGAFRAGRGSSSGLQNQNDPWHPVNPLASC